MPFIGLRQDKVSEREILDGLIELDITLEQKDAGNGRSLPPE